jgi:PAS domain S-box-containing protein
MNKRYTFVLILLFAFLQFVHPYALGKKRILYISSYNSSFPTYFSHIEGIKDVLGDNDFIIDVEYLDGKRFDNELATYLLDFMLDYKIGTGIKYDLVLVADDLAFSYALGQKDNLFKDIPIVFFGINDVKQAILQDEDPQVTGVVENISCVETFELMRKLFPASDKLYVISDNTISGMASYANFKDCVGNKQDVEIHHISLKDMDFSLFEKELEKVSPGCPVLLLSALKDKDNEVMSFDESLDLINENLKAPLFHLWYHGIDHGVFGGKVVNHKDQARRASLMAKEILEGAASVNFKVVSDNPNQYIFNYNELKRFHINKRRLPEGSELYGLPDTFFFKYRQEIYVGIVFFIFQFVLIFYLLFSIRKRVEYEKQLKKQMDDYLKLNEENKKTNIELRNANVDLTEAEYRLKINMSELAHKKQELELSEERFRLAIRSSNDGLWDWNIETNEHYFSPRCKEMLGYTGDELPNELNSWYNLIYVDDRTEATGTIKDLVRGRIEKYEIRFRMLRKSGRMVHILSRGLAMKGPDGKVRRVIATHLDLTERVEYEAQLKAQVDENLSLYEEYKIIGEQLNKKNKDLLKVEEELRVYIAELNRKNVALAESEEKYRFLFDNLSEAFVLFEFVKGITQDQDDFIIKEVNSRFLETHSLEYQSVINKPVSELFPDKKDLWLENFRDVALLGNSVKIIDYSFKLDKYFQVNAFSPKKMFFAGIFNDITESVYAKEELLAEKERNEYILKGTNAGTWDLNLITSELVINEKWAQLIGYQLDELGLFNADLAFSYIHPEDADYVKKEMKYAIGDINYYFDVEFRMRHKAGNWVWIHSRGDVVEFDTDGEAVRMAGTHIDVTVQRKVKMSLIESEKRFKTIFDKSKTVMMLIDPVTKEIVDANEIAAGFYGYEISELIGMNMQRINMLTEQKMKEEMSKALQEKRNYFKFVHKLKNGEIRNVDVYSSPILVNDENILHAIVIDTTQAVEAEFAKQQVNRRFVGLEKIVHYKANSINDLLDFTLREIIKFTRSELGAVYHFDEDNRIFYLNNWSDSVLLSHDFNEESVKTDCLSMAAKSKKPVLMNDTDGKYPFCKEGRESTGILKSITIPIVADGKVVALFWLAKENEAYSKIHAEQLRLLLDTTWILVERQRLQDSKK